MSSEELKCPWCGEEMRFDADSVHCWYKCDHCLAASPKAERVWDTTKHTIANWDENRKRAAACCKRVPRWISVEERLPEKHIGVIACCKDKYIDMMTYDGGHWNWNGRHQDSATHWMPLPEPPEEDANES